MSENGTRFLTVLDLRELREHVVAIVRSLPPPDLLARPLHARFRVLSQPKQAAFFDSLKNKFGHGYKLEVALSSGQQARDQEREAAVGYVRQVLGPIAMHELRAVGGVLTFQLAEHLQLSKVLIVMGTRPPSACIAKFALRQTSMEEVFLSIARNSEEERQSTAKPESLATTKLQSGRRELAIA